MKLVVSLFALLSCLFAACTVPPTSQPTATPIPHINLDVPQLKYRLIDEYGIFFCDPDYYPVGRPGQEEQRAQEIFPRIQEDRGLFDAITSHLGIAPGATFTDEQKLAAYREYKKLNAVQLEPQDGAFAFEVRTGEEPEGLLISGTISRNGQVEVQKREVAFLTCPICLSQGTLIDTPTGQIPVEHLKVGMTVWTAAASGDRVAGPVTRLGSLPAPEGHLMVLLALSDGRRLVASPGHPLAHGRSVGELVVGDVVDGAGVVKVERHPYYGETFDLLPAGETGHYWANGILVASTLSNPNSR